MILKMKQFKLLTLLTVFAVLGLSSCDKNDPIPAPVAPTITSIEGSGENKNFDIVIGFSEAVYKNTDTTGDLDENSFNVSISGGSNISSFIVTHSAGQKSADIKIELDEYSNGSEQVTVTPKNGTSIYNATAVAMASNQTQTVGLDGTVHETITITDDGTGTGTTTWSANNVYLLDGLVFVNDGDILTIEAGTVIKGKAGQGENASALIVARGAKIMAMGTSIAPIILTAEADDLNGSVQDLTDGLWGGLIVLGKGTLNTVPGEQQIEGIPQTEPRGVYGGTDDADDSGEIHYVSIRHGGSDIGEGNEINGLTLGGVGSTTIIEYVEVFANKDDGVEFFGGMPRLNNIVVAFCGDDSYDYDQGFRGYGQFWVAVQGYERGDRLGEHDGGTDPETGEPYAIPTVYNATYVGRGDGASKRTITFRDNAGGNYANSIFYSQEKGIDIELLVDDNSYTRFENGQLTIKNNIFFTIGEPYINVSTGDGVSDADKDAANADLLSYFDTAANEVSDPGFNINGNTFNIIPSNNVGGNLATAPDAWFTTVNYKGAIDPANNWLAGWSLYSKYMN
mgnify:CR=1 FL=1